MKSASRFAQLIQEWYQMWGRERGTPWDKIAWRCWIKWLKNPWPEHKLAGERKERAPRRARDGWRTWRGRGTRARTRPVKQPTKNCSEHRHETIALHQRQISERQLRLSNSGNAPAQGSTRERSKYAIGPTFSQKIKWITLKNVKNEGCLRGGHGWQPAHQTSKGCFE